MSKNVREMSKNLKEMRLEEMDVFWNEAKKIS